MKNLFKILLVTAFLTAASAQAAQILIPPGESVQFVPQQPVNVTCQKSDVAVCSVVKNSASMEYEVWIGNSVAETTLSLDSAVRVTRDLNTAGLCRLAN